MDDCESVMCGPILSIIIPHKNSVLLLLRLLSTVPTCELIEVVVVDDNSCEDERRALEAIRLPANTKVIFLQESGYAGRARNIGLRSAVGAWVIFADADDYFTEDFLSATESYFNKTNLDIVYFGVTSVDTTGCLSYRHVPYSNLIKDYLSGVESAETIRYRHTPPWAKLLNREFLIKEKIFFDEVPASNDISFSVASGHMARNISVCSKVIYVITQSPGSITNTVNKINLESKFKAALRVNLFLREHNKRKYQHSVLYFLYRAWTIDKSMAIKMLLASIKSGNNIFIGFSKISNVLNVIRQRESR